MLKTAPKNFETNTFLQKKHTPKTFQKPPLGIVTPPVFVMFTGGHLPNPLSKSPSTSGMVDLPDVESAVRIGDIFAQLVEFLGVTGEVFHGMVWCDGCFFW